MSHAIVKTTSTIAARPKNTAPFCSRTSTRRSMDCLSGMIVGATLAAVLDDVGQHFERVLDALRPDHAGVQAQVVLEAAAGRENRPRRHRDAPLQRSPLDREGR